MASDNVYYNIDFSGKLVTVVEPMVLKPGDFSLLQNIRYIPNGYGGTSLRGVGGLYKFNGTATTTYTNFKAGIHYRKDQPTETHMLVQALDSTPTAGRILENKTALTLTTTDQGNFESTAVYTLTNTGTGSFNLLPDSCVGFCNGYDSVVWGGNEYRVGSFINLDYVTNTFKYDGTEFVTNNLTTEYVSIKSVASTASGSPTEELLLHANATPLVDSGKTTHVLTASGAAYNTSYKKFGTGSIYFDGTNDKVTGPAADHADFNLTGGVWTIDFWFRISTAKTCTMVTIKKTDDANDYLECGITYASGYPRLTMAMTLAGASAVSLTSAVNIPTGSYETGGSSYYWVHAAFVQNGTAFYIFQNGDLVASSTEDVADKMADQSASFILGTDAAGSNFFSGYMDEIRILKTTAAWTAAFTPPSVEYAATTYTTSAQAFIGSPRPLNGFKLYVGTANDQTSSLSSVKYWNGYDWALCTTVVDGTTSGGKTLATTGSVTFDSTVTTAKARMLYNQHAYWYLVTWAGMNNSTLPTIYYVTVSSPMQAFTDIWDGVPKSCSLVWKQTSADKYLEFTTEVLTDDARKLGGSGGTFMTLASLATSDAIYLGSYYRLQGFNVVFTGAANATNNTQALMYVYYWDGDSWVHVNGLQDTTLGGASENITLHQNGIVSWYPPSEMSEWKTNVKNDFQLYYYKIQFSHQLGSTVYIDQITTIPAQKTIHPYKYCFSFQGRTVLLNEYNGKQNKILISIPYSTSIFNGDDSFEQEVDDADYLVAGTAIHTRYSDNNFEDAIICSRRKTFLITGTAADNFKIKKISDVYGCLNPNTMKTCHLTTENGKQEVAIWLSQVGVVMYDGISIKRIDDDIRDKFTPNHTNAITYSDLLNMYATFDERHNEYVLFYPNSTNADAWVFNVEFNKWYFVRHVPASSGLLNCGFPVYHANGYQYMFAGSSTGYLYRLDSGNSSDGSNLTRVVQTGDFPLTKEFWHTSQVDWLTFYSKASASADYVTMTHYGDGNTTGTDYTTFTQAHTGYSYNEERFSSSTKIDKAHVLHKFKISYAGDDAANGIEPLLLSIAYRTGVVRTEEPA